MQGLLPRIDGSHTAVDQQALCADFSRNRRTFAWTIRQRHNKSINLLFLLCRIRTVPRRWKAPSVRRRNTLLCRRTRGLFYLLSSSLRFFLICIVFQIDLNLLLFTKCSNLFFFCSKHALSEKAVWNPFIPEEAIKQKCMITSYQQGYFCGSSIWEMMDRMRSVPFTFYPGSNRNFDYFFMFHLNTHSLFTMIIT